MHVAILTCLLSVRPAAAGELPYFVTYSHHMEEPGNLEIALNQVAGSPKGGNPFLSSLLELEYGVTAWWTSELYLAGQTTRGESALFTGYRIENRVRPVWGQRWINPVLYVEYADVNGADKTLREVVGHDSFADAAEPNAETRRERKREIETRLILSSDVRGWNISENFIAEKDLAHEPWEFGYALGVSRPLRLAATAEPCRMCRENFRAGVEAFGGLGDWRSFGLPGTSHYLAPTLAWALPGGTTVAVSPAFGLNGNSHRVLWRFTVACEVNQIGRKAVATKQRRATPQAARAGAKLYARHCQSCHGEAGEGGGRAPALRSPSVKTAAAETLLRVLNNGIERRGMPPWSKLPEEQRRQIVSYLKSLD